MTASVRATFFGRAPATVVRCCILAAEPKPAGSFFVAGGTLSTEATSYVERAADRQLFDALTAGKFCYVLNSRQMGKSSLCVRTMKRLRERGTAVAFIDLTKIGGRNVTPEQWYAGIAVEIGRSLTTRIEVLSFWKENEHLSPVQRLFAAIREVVLEESDGLIAVFFDEIDATRSLSFSADEFFAAIRECYNRRVQDPVYNRLTFCLLGVAVPSDLINSPTSTPFNIGERIYLRDFTLDESMALTQGLDGSRVLVERIHHWTNGHPFLTQSLCAAAMELGIRNPEEIDDLVRRDLFEPKARETNINLADVANRAVHAGDLEPDAEKFRADLLSQYERAWKGRPVPDDEANRVTALLKLSGIMRSEGNRLIVRNRIYRQVFDRAWVRENMPGQELRRQRRAFWLGVVKTTGLSALVIGAISYLAWSNAALRREAEIAREKARYDAYVADLNSMKPAYQSGDLFRLQELLDETRDRPYRNVEWNYWNAKLNDAPARSPYPRGIGTVSVAGDGRSIVVADPEAHLATVLSIPDLGVVRRLTMPDGVLDVSEIGSRPVWTREVGPGEIRILAGYSHRPVGVVQIRGGFLSNSAQSVNGRFVASNWRTRDESGGYYHVSAWRTDNFTEIWRLFIPGTVTGLAISEDATKVVVGTFGRKAKERAMTMSLIDVRTKKTLDSVFVDRADQIDSSSDAGIVAVGDSIGHTLVRDTRRHRNVLNESGNPVGLSQDGKRLLTLDSDMTAKVWNVDTGALLKAVKCGTAAAMTPDGRYLLSLGPGTRLYEIDSPALGERSRAFSSTTIRPAIRCGPSANIVVPGGADWLFLDPDTLKVDRSLPAGPVSQVSAKGDFLLERDRSGSVVRSTGNGRIVCRMPPLPAFYGFDAAADGRTFVVLDDTYRKLYCFDAAGRQLWDTVMSEPCWNCLSSPDLRLLAVCVVSGDIQLRDLKSGRLIRTLKEGSGDFPYALAFSHDSRYLAAAFGDCRIVVTDLQGVEPPVECRGHRAIIWSIAFSPDGQRLLTSSGDQSARVWDWRTGKELLSIDTVDGRPASVGFDRDGSSIHTVSLSGVVQVFPTPWR